MQVRNDDPYSLPLPPSRKEVESFKFGWQILDAPREANLNWKDKSIKFIDEVFPGFPSLTIQNEIDELGRAIEAKFAPLTEFNRRLNDNGQGEWYNKLATFLVKLPFRVVRNILKLLYNIIKGILHALVHPLEGLKNVAKMLVTLVHELTKPETWAKMGAGLMGASLGQVLVTGNPISVILGFPIGTLICGAGLIGVACTTEKDFESTFLSLLAELTESALTGLCMGLIVGGIQNAINSHAVKVTTYEQAKEVADKIAQKYNIPDWKYSATPDPSGSITINYYDLHPKNLFNLDTNSATFYNTNSINARLVLSPDAPTQATLITFNHNYYNSTLEYVLDNIQYPRPLVSEMLTTMGPAAGTINQEIL